MVKNLTTVGICAFLALTGYIYVQNIQKQIENKKEQKKLMVEAELLGISFEKGDCEIEYSCSDPKACNYSTSETNIDNRNCVYTNGPCQTCSGETDGTGFIINNDEDGDGICDNNMSIGELNKIITNKEKSDSENALKARLLDINIDHDSDPKTNTTNVIVDASNSYDPEGDSISYRWSSKDVRITDKTSPIVEFEVKSKKDEVATYQLNLKVTDTYGGTANDSVIINVNDELNNNPNIDIDKWEMKNQ